MGPLHSYVLGLVIDLAPVNPDATADLVAGNVRCAVFSLAFGSATSAVERTPA